jgi:hypothetical protein
VPGHREIEENEVAHKSARTGSECPFIGLELISIIPEGAAIRDWMNAIKNTDSSYMDINMRRVSFKDPLQKRR